MPAPRDGRPPKKYPPIVPGQRFGNLVTVRLEKGVAGRKYTADNGKRYYTGAEWLCVCDCGKKIWVCVSYLNAGMKKRCAWSCPVRGGRTHGLLSGKNKRTNASTYSSFYSMNYRCRADERYVANGTNVCERWQGPEGFKNFLADMGLRPSKTSLDRKNPWGNYSPENCGWSSAKWQAANQRNKWVQRNPVKAAKLQVNAAVMAEEERLAAAYSGTDEGIAY